MYSDYQYHVGQRVAFNRSYSFRAGKSEIHGTILEYVDHRNGGDIYLIRLDESPYIIFSKFDITEYNDIEMTMGVHEKFLSPLDEPDVYIVEEPVDAVNIDSVLSIL